MTPALLSPHPLGATLPGVYAEDALVQVLCSAFDGVLAPVFDVLDCFPAYLDPGTAPPDVLQWLATWVALGQADAADEEQLRQLVRQAVEVGKLRGTVEGVRAAVRIAFGLPVEVHESGGVSWSVAPGSALPGDSKLQLRVVVLAEEPGQVDVHKLDALVAAVKPVHVPHMVEVVEPS